MTEADFDDVIAALNKVASYYNQKKAEPSAVQIMKGCATMSLINHDKTDWGRFALTENEKFMLKTYIYREDDYD